jgi:hypothetical protein
MLVKVCEIVEHPENADKAASGESPLEKTTRYPGSIEAIADLMKGLAPAVRDRSAAVTRIVSEAQRLERADLFPADLLKAAQHDAAEIASIRDGLVACINAELQELCDGEPELCDIEQLLCSLRMLMCWWEHEALGGETTSPYSADGDMDEVALWLAAQPEQEKAMGDTTVDTTKTEPAVEKAATTEPVTEPATTTTGTVAVPAALTELVKAAVAEATKDSDERVKALEAELAKVKATPVPGGPAIARTGGETQAAERAEKSAHFDYLARSVTDPDLRAFYRDEAERLSQSGSES